jgi:hypothetical protein
MANQNVRLTVCATAQDVAEAKALDEGLGYTIVGEFTNSPLDLSRKVDGPIVDLCYLSPMNANPGTNATSPLKLVISKRLAP